MAVFNVYERKLKEQLERKGFLFSGHYGEGIDKPIQFTMAGDVRKLSKRERLYVKPIGQLTKKREHFYIPK